MPNIGNHVDAVFIPESVNTSTKLRINDADGSIVLGGITTGNSTTDSGVIFDHGTGSTVKGGIFTEVDGEILSYGINVDQVDTGYDTSRVGGIFRLDTRNGNSTDFNGECFIIKGRSKGTAKVEYNALGIDLDDGNTILVPHKGNVGIGTRETSAKLHIAGGNSIRLGDNEISNVNSSTLYGPNAVTNGDFNNANLTGWTSGVAHNSFSATNQLVITNSSGGQGPYQSFTTSVGQIYEVSILMNGTGAFATLISGSGLTGNELLVLQGGSSESTVIGTFTAMGSLTTISLTVPASGASGLFDTILVRAVNGSEGDGITITNAVSSDSLAIFKTDGAVELYHDNSKKFETTSTGIEVSGSGNVQSLITSTGAQSDLFFKCKDTAYSTIIFGDQNNAHRRGIRYDANTDKLEFKGVNMTANHISIDSSGNVALIGELRGPASFVIDPAAVGDNTGAVVIKGDLQVDGTTTTINSTTLTVDDKNIVLASGAANSAAADGAGITIDGANENLTWVDSSESFRFSTRLAIGNASTKASNLRLSKNLGGESLATYYGILNNGFIQPDVTSTAHYNFVQAKTAGNSGTAYTINNIHGYAATVGSTSISADSTITNLIGFIVKDNWIVGTNNYGFKGEIAEAANRWNVYMDGTAPNYFAGSVGIGTDNPLAPLHISGAGASTALIKIEDNDNGFAASEIGVENGGRDLKIAAPQDIYFEDISTGVRHVYIENGGNVGIGTDDPSGELHIYQPTGQATTLKIEGGSPELWFKDVDETPIFRQIINANGWNVQPGTGSVTSPTWSSVALIVDGNGDVGIGTDNPSTKVEVAGTGSPALRVTDLDGTNTYGQISSNNGTFIIESRNNTDDGQILFRGRDGSGANEYARFDESGKLLIGNDTVRNVSGSASQSQLQIEGISTNTSSLTLINNQNTTNSAHIRFGKTRGTSVGAVTTVADGDKLGVISFSGADGTDLENDTALIQAVVNGTVSGDTVPTDIIFETSATNGNSKQERLRITSDGKVGINESSPDSILHAYNPTTLGNTAGDEQDILRLEGHVANDGILDFRNVRLSAGSDWNTSTFRIQRVVDTSKMGYIDFGTGSGSSGRDIQFGNGSGTIMMHLDTTGKVGIGTITPAHKLHVVQESTDTYGAGVARFTYIDTNASDNAGSASTYFDAQFKTGHSYFKSFITGNSTDFLIVDQDNSSSRAAFAVEGDAGSNKIIYAMSNGNVGIGTNNPTKTLDVHGNVLINSPGSTPISLTVQTNAESGHDAKISIRGARTACDTCDIALLEFDNKTSSSYTMARIAARDPSANHSLKHGILVFSTGDDGTVSDAMVIDERGRVGIGTTNPDTAIFSTEKSDTTSYPFTTDQSSVYAYTPYPQEICIRNTADDVTNGFCGIAFNPGSAATADKHAFARITAIDTGDYKSDIAFGTRNTNFKERMRITAGGPVGINTTNPSARLHVYSDTTETGIIVEDNLEGVVFTAGDSNGDVVVHNKLYVGGTTNYLSSQPTGTYGSIQINGDGKGGWEGYSIDGRAVFMHDGTGTMGLYDDVNNHWAFRHIMGDTSTTQIRSGNNVNTIVCTGTNQVGMGIDTPARGPLHIHQGTTGDTQIHMTNSETGTSSTDGFTIFTGGSDGSHSGFVNREASARIRFLMHPNGGSDVTDQMVLLANGNLGLGISDPTEKLHINNGKIHVEGAVLNANNEFAIKSEATIDSVNRDLVFNLRLQTTMTDAGTTTADREQGGIYNIVTSNATGGETNHEHRPYGVWNNLDIYGDGDLVAGTYNDVGMYHTAGTATLVTGSYDIAQSRSSGNISSLYGNYSLAQATSGSTGNITKIVGVRARVNCAGTAAPNSTDQYAVWGNIDNDSDVTATGTVALFYGTYDTTDAITTPYGIYIAQSSLSHYINGSLGLGNASNPRSYSANAALHIGDETTAATTNEIVFGKRVTTSQSNLPRIGHCDVSGGGANNDLGLNACSSGGSIALFTGNGTNGYGHSSNALRMIIRSTGKVGINESDPDNLLHVRNDNSPAAKFGGEGGGEYYLELGQLATSSSPGINATGVNASLRLHLNGGEEMRIANGGNVGIGTNDPETKLDVRGNAYIGASADISPTSAGAGQIMINANGYTPYIAADATAMYVGHNSSSRQLRFQTNETTRMYISGEGSNVGIGTTHHVSYALSVRNITAASTSGGIFIDCNDWSSNSSEYGINIDADSTSRINLTNNRTHRGYSADLRFRVASNASTATGTRQSAYGIYASAMFDDTDDTDGKLYYVWGGYFRSRIDGVNASNIRGSYSLCQCGDNATGSARTVDNAYGAMHYMVNDGNQTTITKAYGTYSHVNQDDTGGTMVDAYGVYSRVDRDSGTGTTGYAFRGSIEGTWGTKRGLWITGDTENSVDGSFTAASKNFRIPHPLPELSETKDLVHVSIEAPAHDLIYRGKSELVDGSATINLDTKFGMTEGTFVALNRNIQCFTSNESDWSAVRGSVSGNILTIECQDGSSTALISWMVIGERQDAKVKSLLTTDAAGNLILEPDQIPEEPDPGKPEIDDEV